MLMTTTNGFDGFKVKKYLGVISRDIVFRSGLGKSISAAFSNFVADFSLRDVEMSGSSSLIANAKNYLMEQFEKTASARGANAIIGIDIETAFGESLARIAVSGTAVVVAPIAADVVIEETPTAEISADNDYSTSATPVTMTNSPKDFEPVELSVSNSFNSCEVVMILQPSLDGWMPSDLIADVEFTSIFGDVQSVEKVCFLGIRKNGFYYESKPVSIRLADHISACIASCTVRIRKYKKDNNVVDISSSPMHSVEKRVFEQKYNTDAFGWIIDSTPGYIRCPNCQAKVLKSDMKYQTACKSCGFPRSKV